MAARFTRTAKSRAEQRLPAPPEPTPGALPAEDLPARIGTYSDRDVWGIEYVRPIVPTAAQNDQVCMAQLEMINHLAAAPNGGSRARALVVTGPGSSHDRQRAASWPSPGSFSWPPSAGQEAVWVQVVLVEGPESWRCSRLRLQDAWSELQTAYDMFADMGAAGFAERARDRAFPHWGEGSSAGRQSSD